jgi:hypothetical protein
VSGSGSGADPQIQTHLDRHWWIIVPVEIADALTIDMVLDTGSPFSSISEPTRDELVRRGLLEQKDERRFVLRHLAVQGQALPDLEIRMSRRATQVGAAGILGIDFLGRFTDVHFHVPTMRLTLSRHS